MEQKNVSPDEFTIILRAFNNMVVNNPKPDTIKSQLIELKESAESSIELNSRQKEAIMARINNYFDGTYGKTKQGIEFKQA